MSAAVSAAVSAAYETLREAARPLREARERPLRPLLRVDLTTSSVAAGGDATLAALRRALRERQLDCDLITVGTLGLSFLQPVVELQRPGRAPVVYGPLAAAEADAFVAAALQGQGEAAHWALGVRAPAGEEGLPSLFAHPFWAPQERRLMEWMGVIDPEDVDEAIGVGRYAGLERALAMEPAAICDLVEEAGLLGRGGAGFPAGRKWKFLLGAPGPLKYQVCNADEGDPGAFVNRVLMESDPHLVIEGMAIAAQATGARHGFVYIRDEYPLSIVRMQRAIEGAGARGLLGEGILGTDLCFTLEVVRGAGSYVCGEESGLIASVEGLRGMPKIRPPFPAQRGVFGRPSNVNNTETFANVPLVLQHGAAWYREQGTASDPGTKMFSVSGAVARSGVLELPFGTSLATALLEAGGGPPPGRRPKGVQPGGPLGGMFSAEELALPLERPPFTELGVLLGSGGLILFDDRACALDLALYFSEFCEDESCGRCTTCHGGSQRLVEILRRIAGGGGRESDLERIGLLDRALQNANCVHGQFTPYAVRAAVRHFGAEIEAHIRERRCPAGVCRGLIRHRITAPADPALVEAADLCPTDAIVPAGVLEGVAAGVAGGAEGGAGYGIDDGACIQCGLCRELAPAAVTVEERFPAPTPA